MIATTTTRSIFQMFYTRKRTQALLEAKGIKVKSIEKVSITKPNGQLYNCIRFAGKHPDLLRSPF